MRNQPLSSVLRLSTVSVACGCVSTTRLQDLVFVPSLGFAAFLVLLFCVSSLKPFCFACRVFWYTTVFLARCDRVSIFVSWLASQPFVANGCSGSRLFCIYPSWCERVHPFVLWGFGYLDCSSGGFEYQPSFWWFMYQPGYYYRVNMSQPIVVSLLRLVCPEELTSFFVP